MRKFCCAVIALLCLPAGSAADPVTVTANAARVFVVGGGDPRALISVWHHNMAGLVDLSITGDLFDPQPFLNLCTVCRTGEAFSPSITVSGDALGVGTAFVGEPADAVRIDALSLSGMLTFDAGTIALPDDAPDLFNVFLPLTISGFLTGSTGGAVVLRVEPFSLPGIAWVQFATSAAADGGRVFSVQAFDLVGSDIVAPVPEPASLLLVSGGIAGLAYRRRGRGGIAPGQDGVAQIL